MKKNLLSLFLIFISASVFMAQSCPVASTPTSNCSGNNNIQAFSLNGIFASGNGGCGTNGYNSFTTPIWYLGLGNTYPWTATTNTNVNNTSGMALSVWFDLNNDGLFVPTERLIAHTNGYSQSGNVTIPSTAVVGVNIKMRVRARNVTGNVLATEACIDWAYGPGQPGGETEDYIVQFTCPVPVSISTNSSNICSGKTAVITATGATGYTWQPGNMSGATISVTPSTGTIYTLTAQDAQGCVTPGRTIAISVDPTPTLNVSSNPSTPVCIGNSFTLNASGAANYLWQPGNQNGPSPVVSPTTSTNYTVTGTSGNCSGNAVVNTVVNPLPNVTASPSSTTICYNTGADLSAGGATNYTWAPGGLTGNSISPSLTISTTYTVTGDDANGCRNTAVANISVNPAPAFSYSTNGLTVTVINNSSSALSGFIWNFGDLTVSNQFQPAPHTYPTAGTYIIELEANSPSPCPKVRTSFVITVPSNNSGGTGIMEGDLNKFVSIFPNPAGDFLKMKIELSSYRKLNVEIYNALGTCIKKIDQGNLESGEIEIDISELNGGVYFVRLYGPGITGTKSFIKN